MSARRSKKQQTTKSPGSGKTSKVSQAKDDREFVAEAEELLDRLSGGLSELHEERAGDEEVDPDLLNRIFRAAHSLKGLAGLFGLDGISELSHRMEDILDGVRLGRVSLRSPAFALLDEGVSLLAATMTRLEQGRDPAREEEQARLDDFVARIDRAVREAEPVPGEDLEALGLDPSLLRALSEYEEHRLRENLRRGRHLARVESTFELSTFEEGLAALSAAVREIGEVVSTLPSPGDGPASQIRFSLLVATSLEAEPLASRLDLPSDRVQLVHRAEVSRAQPDETDSTARALAPAAGAEAPELESLRSISDTVRVDIRKLDELMNLVGDLVIQRNGIAVIAQRLLEGPGTARVGAELQKTHKALDRKLKALQAGVLDVRMVPLRQIFEKLSRAVRRLRRDLGKDVELEFHGAETELDKLIVEQLIDPLVQLVRNAFDHALEAPTERRAAGKSERGRIRVGALQRGNHVVLEISDDGRGMDVDAIRSNAIARGLISESDTLSHKEILNLVFEAGLSTADGVSETSGRGVGMDVVRTNLAEMGGMVDLVSTAGEGTCVTITLPITLAIIQALIVGVGDECYAIPLSSVLETLTVEPSQIGRMEDREILNLRGEPLLLRRLGEEFEIPAAAHAERQFVVVLGLGSQRLGLIVDRLEGQQDAVIKPIKGPLPQIRGIAGATELGDRGAILVIDVSAIVGDAVRRREAA